jgi:hypothetical protein
MGMAASAMPMFFLVSCPVIHGSQKKNAGSLSIFDLWPPEINIFFSIAGVLPLAQPGKAAKLKAFVLSRHPPA